MSEHPILFSTAMVQAILAVRKCQTRRVINQVSGIGKVAEIGPASSLPKFGYDWSIRSARSGLWHELSNKSLLARTPYQPGDVLWVREAWAYVDGEVWYVADGIEWPREDGVKLRPSIFMPRWASRLRLTVIGVRIERLQDITLGGIAAEGWPDAPKEDTVWLPDLPEIQIAGFEWFIGVWDSINARKGFPFESNPFVKVISFKVNTGE